MTWKKILEITRSLSFKIINRSFEEFISSSLYVAGIYEFSSLSFHVVSQHYTCYTFSWNSLVRCYIANQIAEILRAAFYFVPICTENQIKMEPVKFLWRWLLHHHWLQYHLFKYLACKG